MAEISASTVRAWATQRREEARREIAAWDEFLRRLDMFPDASSRPSVPDLAPGRAPSDPLNIPPTNIPMPTGTKSPRQPTEGRQKDPAVAATIEATKAFLPTLGRPAGINEIYNEMLRLNIPIGGKAPKRTLDARLRYSGEFKGVPGKGWWRADRPLPGQDDVAATDDHVEEPSQNLYRGGTL